MLQNIRVISAVLVMGLLAACGTDEDLIETPDPLGNFRLEHNIVVTKNAQKGPLSRDGDLVAIKKSLTGALQDRLGRYDGDMRYHIGINLDAYVLALPGVPVVLNPKSAYIMSVTVWDDAAQNTINKEAKQMTILENLTGATLVSSGLTQSSEQQMENLSRAAARAVENWLRENEAWFTEAENAKRKALGAYQAPPAAN